MLYSLYQNYDTKALWFLVSKLKALYSTSDSEMVKLLDMYVVIIQDIDVGVKISPRFHQIALQHKKSHGGGGRGIPRPPSLPRALHTDRRCPPNNPYHLILPPP